MLLILKEDTMITVFPFTKKPPSCTLTCGFQYVRKTTINSKITIMDKKEALEIAQQYVDAVKEHNLQITEAKLFGSYATGSADQWSDIDICIVSPKFENSFESRVQLMHLKHSIDERIEPHPFTPEDIQSKWIPIALNIRKYGIPLKI